MALLLVMFILVLGYTYVSRVPSERFKLSRSSGWETYVRLSAAGLRFLFSSVLFSFALYIVTSLLLRAVDFLFGSSLNDLFSNFLHTTLFLNIKIYQALLAGLAYVFCFSEVSKEDKDAWKSQTHGNVLDLVLLATNSLTPVRISCKSRKVYIGWVQLGFPEKAELDCIYILPLLSGHRDKDKLRVTVDYNYDEVYDRLGLWDTQEKAGEVKLTDFIMAVRMAEIESISLYRPELTAYFPTPSGNMSDNVSEGSES
jgi:hypothetical protein